MPLVAASAHPGLVRLALDGAALGADLLTDVEGVPALAALYILVFFSLFG